jgi:hypothetical protein
MAMHGMAERKLSVDLVAIATPHSGSRQIARFLEVTDDRCGCSFRYSHIGRNVADSGGWIGVDALQHVRVIR